MDAWQIQCCGDAFRVGSKVSWTLVPEPETDYLAAVIGDAVALTVTHWEEHHADSPEPAPKTAGVVRSIRAARCRYGRDPQQSAGGLYPVKGSGTLAAVESADGWEADDGDAKFVGYVIELDAG
jgi:hypothetical protein